ncbi:MAG: 2-hydroxychromene-2-carboxylate isomerase [Pseudomonadota bacterium]
MTTIDYYFTTVSPYAYLTGDRIERIAEKHGARLAYRPVDLGKVFPTTGGVPLAKRAPARRAYRFQELRRWSQALEMPITLEPAHFPVPPEASSLAICAAIRLGADAGALARYYLAACWVEDRDISDPGVVAAGLEAVGLEGHAVTGADREMFDANAEAALAAGVFGAPSFVVGDELFWGQDRLDMLDLFLSGKVRGAA